ncbi:hypothetical protein TNIN_181271 [Trichonephila inaurata madagascariensis]|uniref:Uncharacterized protein n=1 Tax=Trichonephila inaurata madagascariensis TaxID=2747483 RepID=A0A8X6XX01_9ARAC|nr:hypothetical protein TNIN_181271 [Trichonephila inaurata madagascariensis]
MCLATKVSSGNELKLVEVSFPHRYELFFQGTKGGGDFEKSASKRQPLGKRKEWKRKRRRCFMRSRNYLRALNERRVIEKYDNHSQSGYCPRRNTRNGIKGFCQKSRRVTTFFHASVRACHL